MAQRKGKSIISVVLIGFNYGIAMVDVLPARYARQAE
jgi:hypothetical protein